MNPQNYPSAFPAGMYGQEPAGPGRYGTQYEARGGIRKPAYDAVMATALVLAFLWFLVLVWPFGWIRVVGNVNIYASLFSIQFELGRGVQAIAWLASQDWSSPTDKHSILDTMRVVCSNNLSKYP